MKTEHQETHERLHSALDELFADYITHHPDQREFLNTPVHELITWSAAQVINPSE